MDYTTIISELDAEIARLQKARSALAGLSGNSVRPEARPKQKKMSAAARARIGAAKRQWWAERKAKAKRKSAKK